MAEHHVVEHVVDRTDSGTGIGVILGIVLALLIAAVVIFFMFLGGPGRFAGAPANPASNTNVNVPAQPQQPQSGPNITIPREIDVNVNQPPAQAPAP